MVGADTDLITFVFQKQTQKVPLVDSSSLKASFLFTPLSYDFRISILFMTLPLRLATTKRMHPLMEARMNSKRVKQRRQVIIIINNNNQRTRKVRKKIWKTTFCANWRTEQLENYVAYHKCLEMTGKYGGYLNDFWSAYGNEWAILRWYASNVADENTPTPDPTRETKQSS